MKKTLLFLLVIIAMVSCKKADTEEAIKYNDSLVNSFEPFTQQMVEFEMALYDSDANNIVEMHKDLAEKIDSIVEFISDMPAFDGNEELKGAALNIVKYYDHVIDSEYGNIVEMIKSDTLTAEDEQKIEASINATYTKEAEYYAEFEKKQKEFAKKYKFNVNKKEK